MVLTKEANELLTRVGPDTPMGRAFRRYWIPALLSRELADPDGAPVRVRLLGEDLVAFRDSQGNVGLIDEYCAHRQASLFFGRNEESGLRCIYHGFKYGADGTILDTPCEGPDSTIRQDVRLKAYPCRDINGIIWTYMGPPEKMPLLPDCLWFTVPPSHTEVIKFRNECNYLQALEGDCDHPHVTYLHRRGEGLPAPEDTAPTFEIEFTFWGVRAVTSRKMGDQKLIRMNLFMMPFVGLIAGDLDGGRQTGDYRNAIHAIYQVPADDFNTTRYDILARRDAPYDGSYRSHYSEELTRDYRKIANKTNNYLQDRELMKTSVYSGIPFGNHTQDACVTESMGPIMDRSREHLGDSDQHVVAVRQMLFQAVDAIAQGADPPGLAFQPEKNDFSDLYCATGRGPQSAPWRQIILGR